jgi:hypothetical protein
MTASSSELQTCGMPRNFWNLMVLSFSFLMIFTAFSTAQTFSTPLLGDLGSYSLMVRVHCPLLPLLPPPLCARD